jgi:hypothetical protein
VALFRALKQRTVTSIGSRQGSFAAPGYGAEI